MASEPTCDGRHWDKDTDDYDPAFHGPLHKVRVTNAMGHSWFFTYCQDCEKIDREHGLTVERVES